MARSMFSIRDPVHLHDMEFDPCEGRNIQPFPQLLVDSLIDFDRAGPRPQEQPAPPTGDAKEKRG
jgi:hypothetical protein